MEIARSRVLVGGLLLVGIAIGTLFWSWQADPGDSEQEVTTDPMAPQTQVASTKEEASPQDRVPLRPTEVDEATDTSRPDPERLWGRVLSAIDDRPVSNAQVTLLYRDADEFRSIDQEYNKHIETIASVYTDDEGRFAFRVPRAKRHRLLVEASGFAPTTTIHCVGGIEVVVRVGLGATVSGVVTDEHTTDPVSGVRLQLLIPGEAVELAAGTTAADGSFYFENVQATGAILLVTPQRHEVTSHSLTIQAGGDHHVEVELSMGRSLRGRVTDAASGNPIAGAEVSDRWTFSRIVQTDAEGRYELTGLSGRGEVRVRAPGYSKFARSIPTGASDMDVTLHRGASVIGRFVFDEETTDKGIYSAVGASFALSPGVQGSDIRPVDVRPDGRFSVGGLNSEYHYALYVRGRDIGTQVRILPRRLLDGEELNLGNVHLRAAGGLEGRVVDNHGAVLARTEVTIQGHNSDARQLIDEQRMAGNLRADAYYTPVMHFTSRDILTGTDGSFRFTDLAAGEYVLSVRPYGHDQTSRERYDPFQVNDGEVRGDVELVFDMGLSISGTVRLADGTPLPEGGTFLQAYRPGQRSLRAAVRLDGSFRFEKLEEGEYVITALRGPEGWALSPITTNAGVEGLEIVLQQAATIEGRVVDTKGNPVPAGVWSQHASGVSPAAAIFRTDSEGRFRLFVAPDFVGVVHAFHSDADYRSVEVENIVAGTRDLILTVPDSH